MPSNVCILLDYLKTWFAPALCFIIALLAQACISLLRKFSSEKYNAANFTSIFTLTILNILYCRRCIVMLKNGPFPASFLNICRCTINSKWMFFTKIAGGWIWSRDLWFQKKRLCQLRDREREGGKCSDENWNKHFILQTLFSHVEKWATLASLFVVFLSFIVKRKLMFFIKIADR